MTQKPQIPLVPAPPTRVLEAMRERLSPREFQAFSALIAVRRAAQQIENAVSEWMADSAGNIARYQILLFVMAYGGEGVAHKDIVTAAGVSRATVSGLMAGLEKDGLVTSVVDEADRRSMIARLTPEGSAIIERAVTANAGRLRAVFAGMSGEEITAITSQMQRVREGFAAVKK